MKKTYSFIIAAALLLTLLSAFIVKTVGVADFERGSFSASLIANHYPPGTDDFVHRGFPVAYYTAYNVLPDPEMNHQNIAILYLLADFLAMTAILYIITRIVAKYVHWGSH